MADVRNRFFVPNVEEFFNDLLRTLHQCDENYLDEGSEEFISRRLEQYQQTLRVMYSRVREYRPNAPVQLLEDMEQLLDIISSKIEQLQSLYDDNYFEDRMDTVNNEQRTSLSAHMHLGNVGRPRYEITQEQIELLHDALGFRWADIARMLGVSSRTLIRRRQDFSMPVGHQQNFSTLSDDALDRVISEILAITPQSGLRLVQGALRSRGYRIQRRRIIEALQRLDPITSALRQTRGIIRRTYRVPGPNSLW